MPSIVCNDSFACERIEYENAGLRSGDRLTPCEREETEKS